MVSEGLQYYYDRLGKRLYPHYVPSNKSIVGDFVLQDAPEDCTKYHLPFRNYEKKIDANGKKMADFKGKHKIEHRLYGGAYIITDNFVNFYGKLEIKNFEDIKFIPKDDEDLKLMGVFSKWLIEEAVTPFMVGLWETANPNSSFKVSRSEDLCYMCFPNKEASFSLRNLREDVALLKGVPEFKWEVFDKGHELRQVFLNPNRREKVMDEYKQMLATKPELSKALQKLHMVKGSFAFELARQYFKFISDGGSKNA